MQQPPRWCSSWRHQLLCDATNCIKSHHSHYNNYWYLLLLLLLPPLPVYVQLGECPPAKRLPLRTLFTDVTTQSMTSPLYGLHTAARYCTLKVAKPVPSCLITPCAVGQAAAGGGAAVSTLVYSNMPLSLYLIRCSVDDPGMR